MEKGEKFIVKLVKENGANNNFWMHIIMVFCPHTQKILFFVVYIIDIERLPIHSMENK